MKLFTKCLSVLTALTLTICSSPDVYSSAEISEKTSYTLSFDLDGGICEDYDLPDMSVEGGSSIFIPEGEPEKDGYYFSGWTYNNYILYEPNDSFKMPEEDTVLTPVWFKAGDKDFHKITFMADGGRFIEELNEYEIISGLFLVIPRDVVAKDGFQQYGWTDGEHDFQKGEKMIIPDHDTELYPIWRAFRNVHYNAGDFENLVGGTDVQFERIAGQSFELADNTRFARKGYNLTGWHCENNGQDYLTSATYIMPDEEAYFTAIWSPMSYNVKFSASTSQITKVKASYGESLVVPECEFTKSGYVFGGWTYKGKTYWPGDNFEIPALLKGESIVFGCNWVKEADISDEQLNCFSLIDAKRAYKKGKITLEELQKQEDFLLNK